MGRILTGHAGSTEKSIIMLGITPNTYRTGKIAEDLACRFLNRQGLKLLTKNFRSRRGEIDLIMQDGDIIVFVEVRSRKNNQVMNVIETIDPVKRARIIQTCQQYLQGKKSYNQHACRFDIVLITGQLDAAEIEWIKNAFEA